MDLSAYVTLPNLSLFSLSQPFLFQSDFTFPDNNLTVSFGVIGGFTFYELMRRGVPLHLIETYMNEAKIVDQEK